MKQKNYKTVSCVVIDDDLLQISILKQLIKDREELTLVNVFSNPKKALAFFSESTIDIAFIDIQMDEMDGITLTKNLSKKTIPILVSGSEKYALDAFTVDAVDYLVKPFTNEKFNNAVNKALDLVLAKRLKTEFEKNSDTNNKHITIVFKRKSHKIALNDIKYIESKKEYLIIHTINNNVKYLDSLKNIALVLNKNTFIKVHRSFIINKKFITSHNSSSVTIDNDFTINIGRIYRASFKTFCQKYYK